jgi:hypothetical protein
VLELEGCAHYTGAISLFYFHLVWFLEMKSHYIAWLALNSWAQLSSCLNLLCFGNYRQAALAQFLYLFAQDMRKLCPTITALL